ncbi:MAG: ABC transporter ATP-binding protein [Deltaproteobacteria bacterium]|nr:ABC transporter ATP-binding protein [Deltaproteobacteria bacterium]MBW2070156.1 ABC transporter ATP-binding protein [Deltaproteobacteria bacterium]
MLEIENLHIYYGGIHALKGISLTVPEKSIVTLVGSNGAGKSTTLRTVCGLVRAKTGKITFLGQDITRAAVNDVVRSGVVMVPEGRRVFVNLTVWENLRIGAYNRKNMREIKKDIEWVYSIFPRLEERHKQLAGTLSGGEQQMLALGRALMSRPKLIMMDEPSLGLAPILIEEVFRIIAEIHGQGTTILLVEQNAMAALEIADYGYVLETGKITLEGKGSELLENEQIKDAYLGQAVGRRLNH